MATSNHSASRSTDSPSSFTEALNDISGGGGVSLFNNFTIQPQVTVPPLALAFSVGYAVDGFFDFLERLLKTSPKPKRRPKPRSQISDSHLETTTPPPQERYQ